MKTLSIRQPWASLIISGAPVFKSVDNGDGTQSVELEGIVFKDIENRSWRTDYRGRIKIHAPLKADSFESTLKFLLDKIGLSIYAALLLTSPKYAPKGCIIGEVDLMSCVEDSKSPWFTGKYGFVLQNPKAYTTPIKHKGKLGLFES